MGWYDLALLAASFDKCCPNINANVDFNGDKCVNILDAAKLAANWGKTYTVTCNCSKMC